MNAKTVKTGTDSWYISHV